MCNCNLDPYDFALAVPRVAATFVGVVGLTQNASISVTFSCVFEWDRLHLCRDQFALVTPRGHYGRVPEEISSFPPGVADKLKHYVYRLIDPRSGVTFYVGKGQGNRVFAHIHEQLKEDDPNLKLTRIHDIHLSGFEVSHVIHRHGMDEKTAFQVEAAVMDSYPGLTNIAGGVGNSDFGAMHAQEIIQRYSAPIAHFPNRALLISVNRSAADTTLYEATRYAWKIDVKKAKQAEVILPTREGLIVGAFVATEWLEATRENFPGHEPVPGRVGFVGTEAPESMRDLYVGKRVPDEMRKPGSANPIRYAWPKNPV